MLISWFNEKLFLLNLKIIVLYTMPPPMFRDYSAKGGKRKVRASIVGCLQQQSFLHMTELLHISTHRSCDCILGTCTRSSQYKPQNGRVELIMFHM